MSIPAKGGRPSTAAIKKKTSGSRKKVGRPKGDKGIMDEYKARMLNSPKSKHVLKKILDAALDDEHKHQAVAWKIVSDRIVPVSNFEAKDTGTGGIAITINTVAPVVETDVVSEQ